MRLSTARAWLVIVALVLGGSAEARPGGGHPPVGRVGGGGARPAMATRPSMPQARPQMPQARPQMPRPQMPATRPALPTAQRPMARPAPGGMARPQSPNFQRPSVGAVQRPNPLRPSLPNAMARPQPAGPQPGLGARPGLGSIRPSSPAATLPGRPGAAPGIGMTKPAPQPGRPGFGAGLGAASRPGGGFATKPAPPPRPGPIGGGPGAGGGLAGGNRPTRPGLTDVNRPTFNRPTTLPGDLGALGGGNRPGRPGIGGNRPGIGDGNTIWNSGNWNGNNFNNINVGGGWGYPGWGHGGGYGYNHGWVNPHYNGWYNGGWGGNWGYNNGGWWAPFLTGAATWGLISSLGNWGLGYGTLGYGAAGYVNPYYAAMPAAVVASSPYDYSQPVIINNFIPADASSTTTEAAAESQPAEQPTPTDAAVDAALTKFKAGDYAGALAGFDQALRLSPNDSVIHEVRALALFALGRYPEAALALNAVLATAPGMDWTTMSNVYGSIEAYTDHLRTLEAFCRAHPDDAAAHFVLGYHYLVGGHGDMAAAALRIVVAKKPDDVVAKRLLEAISPPADAQPAPDSAPAPAPTGATAPGGAAAPDIDLVGTWRATAGKDTIQFAVTPASTFRWKAQPSGKPVIELEGTIETSGDAIALVTEAAGTMVARVTPKTADSFEFALPAAPRGTPPLVFAREP
ncbi:MAG: tetratricopeptide repeat protein [Pirellulales bacterium]